MVYYLPLIFVVSFVFWFLVFHWAIPKLVAHRNSRRKLAQQKAPVPSLAELRLDAAVADLTLPLSEVVRRAEQVAEDDKDRARRKSRAEGGLVLPPDGRASRLGSKRDSEWRVIDKRDYLQGLYVEEISKPRRDPDESLGKCPVCLEEVTRRTGDQHEHSGVGGYAKCVRCGFSSVSVSSVIVHAMDRHSVRSAREALSLVGRIPWERSFIDLQARWISGEEYR